MLPESHRLPTWVLGTFICLFGSTLTALGLVLQKHSHVSSDFAASGAYCTQKWWVIGFSVFLLAQIINMVSMAMTPQMVLCCLGAWTLVCNVVFAHLILGESVGRQQALAVIGIIISTVLVIYSAPRPRALHLRTVEDFAGRFCSPDFDALTFVMLGILTMLRVLAMSEGPGRSGKGQDWSKAMLLPTSFAAAAAVGAGYTALLFKCIAELMASMATSTNPESSPLHSWKTYAILLAGLSCAPTELHCLNLALQAGDAVFVVPTYLTLSMLAQLSTGAVFFQECRDFTSPMHAATFCLSVALTLACVVAMAHARAIEADVDAGSDANDFKMSSAPELQQGLCAQVTIVDAEPQDNLLSTPRSDRFRSRSGSALSPIVPGFGGAIDVIDGERRSPRRWRQTSR